MKRTGYKFPHAAAYGEHIGRQIAAATKHAKKEG